MFICLNLYMTHAQDMTKGIDLLADLALEMDASNESAAILYTDEDAMNALLIFNHVCGNILIHRHQNDGLDIERASAVSVRMGGLLRQLFKSFTGIDPHEYYKAKK